MDSRVKKKIDKLKHLLFLEKKEEDEFYTKLFMDFSKAKIEKSVKEGICWFPLTFQKRTVESDENIIVTFDLPDDLKDEHQFQPGSAVRIFHTDDNTGAILHTTSGIINLIHQKKVEIACDYSSHPLWMEQETGIGVHLSFSQYTFKVMEQALDGISKAYDNRLAELRDIMMGSRQAGFLPCEPSFDSAWLNQSQQTAVNKILSAKDIAIVHGPPGTGKTTTLVEAIIETLKTETQVMICAYNNIAVDIMAEKLMERGVPVVRIGNPARVTDELLHITYEAQYYEHPYYTDLLSCKKYVKQLRTALKSVSRKNTEQRKRIAAEISDNNYCADILEFNIKSSIFKKSRVVAATMIGASFKILQNMTFSTVFIDEAAQALEPACWVAIAKGRRIIFAGDHNQLPPTIKSYEAAKAGLSRTLFEKIIVRKPDCSALLTTQYRMNDAIMSFSSKWFYEGRLVASPTVKNKMLFDEDIPVEWIDTAQSKAREIRQIHHTSIFNTKEADLILSILFSYMEKLGVSRILEERITFGIISPYAAQVELFREKMKKNPYFEVFLAHKLISIRTIDGFQGQERDVIVISLVRSNSYSTIGFLADYRRINVAITRAKKKLFLTGDTSTLCHDPFFEALFVYVQKNGLVTAYLKDDSVSTAKPSPEENSPVTVNSSKDDGSEVELPVGGTELVTASTCVDNISVSELPPKENELPAKHRSNVLDWIRNFPLKMNRWNTGK